MLTNCMRRMLERKVEGVAVLTFGEEEPVLDQLVHHDIPMVLAEFKLDDPKVSTILLDYSTGIRAAVHHLAALGHSAHRLSGRPAQAALRHHARERLPRGHAGRWPAHTEEVDHRVRPHAQRRRGRLWTQLQRSASRPTAIVCSNDMTAIGVLRAAYMEGLRVPQDLSVIGLDDIDFAEFTLPPLTTIRLSRTDLARAAFEALRQQTEDPENTKLQREFLVSTSLVVRGSTAAPSASRTDRIA